MPAKRLGVLQTFTGEPDEMDMHFIGLVLVIGTIGMLNLRVFWQASADFPVEQARALGNRRFRYERRNRAFGFHLDAHLLYPRHSVRFSRSLPYCWL